MSTPTPQTGTAINNLTNFMGISGTQVQLIIVVGLFIMIFISAGYLFNKRRKK